MRFASHVLFVTGGASGIGAATARQYTAEGGRVAIADRNRDAAEALAAELPGAVAVQCDVADEASVARAVAEVAHRLQRIDHVLNGAGHAAFGPIETFSLSDWELMLRVHVTGTFLTCRATLPHLRAAGGGAVVNVASVAALMARPHLGAYSAAKGAILAFSRQFALDAGADNVRVSVVAPGSVRSGMTEPLYLQRGGGDYAKGAAMVAEATIQKRVAEPEEIAAAVCFLLSDDARFFTGSLLVPDGGMTAI